MLAGSTKGLTVRGYWLAEITLDAQRRARAKAYVYERVQSGQLEPKIAKIFPFEDVVQAYRYMESNEQTGKIVLTVREQSRLLSEYVSTSLSSPHDVTSHSCTLKHC